MIMKELPIYSVNEIEGTYGPTLYVKVSDLIEVLKGMKNVPEYHCETGAYISISDIEDLIKHL